jgi:hypothetical protein
VKLDRMSVINAVIEPISQVRMLESDENRNSQIKLAACGSCKPCAAVLQALGRERVCDPHADRALTASAAHGGGAHYVFG